MGKKLFFKDYSDSELKDVFMNNKSIRDDIGDMMSFSFDLELKDINTDDKLEYFINESRNGVYRLSYWDKKLECVAI